MKGFEIAQKLSSYGGEVYKSIYSIVSIDQVPRDIPEYEYVITNLSPSNEISGSHWLVRFNLKHLEEAFLKKVYSS